MPIHIILPAAGLGTRMAHAGAPKQFLSLAGQPIVAHSVRAFVAVPQVASITVAAREPELGHMAEILASYVPEAMPLLNIVRGGDTRQQSVSRALSSIPAQGEDLVLVHDAVRPMVDAATIQRAIAAAQRSGAAIVGVPALDTIKQVERTSDGAVIATTIPRELIVLAQTPQAFHASVLRRIFEEAEADGFEGTDEASLAERAGVSVTVVAGSSRNIKVTQPGDLELAEFFFAQSRRMETVRV